MLSSSRTSNTYAFLLDALMAAMVRAVGWGKNGLTHRRSSPARFDFLAIRYTQQATGEVFLAAHAGWLASPGHIPWKTRMYTTAS